MKKKNYTYIFLVIFIFLICILFNAANRNNKRNELTLLESNYWNQLSYYVGNDQKNFTSNELTKAIKLSNELITINPTNEYYLLTRGIFLEDIGKTNQALNDFTNAIKINPHYTDAYLQCADLFLKTDKLDLAFSNIFIALKLEKEYFLSYFYAGLAFLQKDEFEKALKCINIAIEINPRYAYLYSNRGLVYESLGKTNLAIKDFEKFIQYENDAFIFNKLAWLFITEPKFKNREKALSFAIKASQQNRAPEILDTLACVYAEYGKFEIAVELEKEAYGKSGDEIYNKMAEVFKQKKTYLEWRKKN